MAFLVLAEGGRSNFQAEALSGLCVCAFMWTPARGGTDRSPEPHEEEEAGKHL